MIPAGGSAQLVVLWPGHDGAVSVDLDGDLADDDTWEVPLVADRLAHSNHYRAVICLAAVIRGETTHDRYINQQVSHNLGQIALQTGVPTLFGVLTCQTLEQAIHRSGGRLGNKGSECAQAALEMMDLLARLPQ